MENTKEKTAGENHRSLSPLEEYINKVYVLVCLLVPGACLCAGVCYTLSKFLGWIPSVNLVVLLVFDITCVIYFFNRHIFCANGILRGRCFTEEIKGW